MKYLLINKSNDRINLFGKIIYPKQEWIVTNIEAYKKLINSGLLKVIPQQVEVEVIKTAEEKMLEREQQNNTAIYMNIENELTEPIKESIKLEDKNKLLQDIKKYPYKDEILKALFHFYIDRTISSDDLKYIKSFYKEIGLTSLLSEKDLKQLDDIMNYEELIAMLLNTIYPKLIENS